MGWYLQLFSLANSNEWQSSYIFFSGYLTLIGYIGQTIAPMQFDTVCFPLSWCAECMFNMQAFLFHLVQGRNWFLCPCSLISPLMVKLVLCELHPWCLLRALFICHSELWPTVYLFHIMIFDPEAESSRKQEAARILSDSLVSGAFLSSKPLILLSYGM